MNEPRFKTRCGATPDLTPIAAICGPSADTPQLAKLEISRKLLIFLVPQEGFEPPTPSLRMRCSTS